MNTELEASFDLLDTWEHRHITYILTVPNNTDNTETLLYVLQISGSATMLFWAHQFSAKNQIS